MCGVIVMIWITNKQTYIAEIYARFQEYVGWWICLFCVCTSLYVNASVGGLSHIIILCNYSAVVLYIYIYIKWLINMC